MNKDEMIKEMAEMLFSELTQRRDAIDIISVAEALYNANYRKIADDEIVIKKSEYEAEQEKAFLEWREEYDQNCLLRLRVSELEKELEKTKLELKIREDTWGIGYDDAVKNYTEQICNIAKKETAREILQGIFGHMGSYQKFCIVNDEHKTLIELDGLWSKAVELAKKYGIELE